MRLIGFNFNKINVEKFTNTFENLKINTNIDISDIEKLKIGLFDKNKEVISVKFIYTVNFDPNHAKIELVGEVILSDESKIIKNILKEWKDKVLEDDFRVFLFNIILRKANLKALQLEDEMNLPLHIPLPTLRKEDIQKSGK